MGAAPPRAGWVRFLTSLGAGAATGVLVAIVLAVADLYLSGHGHRPLGAPLVDWPTLGVHLSLADMIFLVAAVLGARSAWRGTAGGGA
jgi:hypothetical protein